jgi:hypothetical protein
MKKLIFLLILPLYIYGQEKPIDKFIGIPFNSSRVSVLEQIKLKGGDPVEVSDTTIIGAIGIKFAGRTTDLISLRMHNDKFFQGVIILDPELEGKTIEYFITIRNELTEVYGKGKQLTSFQSPYRVGDGYELTAVQTGKGQIASSWTYENQAGDKNWISIDITPDLKIRLTYTEGTTYKEASKQIEKNKAVDY